MGGYGSTRWDWHKKKTAVENCRVISTTCLREEVLTGSSEVIFYLPEEVRVRLTATDCHFGGVRWWFSCPECHLRVGKLYRPPRQQKYACRHCHNLSYRSRQVSGCVKEVHLGRIRKCAKKLGEGRYALVSPIPSRPKGMHHKTYYRLVMELLETETACIRAWKQESHRTQKRLEKQLSKMGITLKEAQ